MSKLRSVNTAFWSDPYIEELDVNQKLLFLYLITNEKTNMLGIYEATIKKISFETSIQKQIIEKAFDKFERDGKVKYVNSFVVLINYMKHQNYNTNMKKSAIDTYNNLPQEMKDSKLIITKERVSEGFESLSKHFGMVRKVEYEVEVEVKDELEDEVKEEVKEKPYRKFKHLSISQKEFDKLKEDYTQSQIDEILDSIENYALNKNYTSLNLTARKWLKKQYPKPQDTPQRINPSAFNPVN